MALVLLDRVLCLQCGFLVVRLLPCLSRSFMSLLDSQYLILLGIRLGRILLSVVRWWLVVAQC